MASKNKVKNKPPIAKKPIPTMKAVTIVEQGPKDSQARVDGYGGHVGPLSTQFSTSLEKYSDDLYKSYTGLANALGFTPVNLSNLKGLNKITAVMKDLSPEKLIKRFEDTVLGGRSLDSMLNLAKDFRKDAVGTLQKLTSGVNIGGMNIGNAIRTGVMTYKEADRIYKAVKNNDWSSLQGIRNGIDIVAKSAFGGALKGIVDLHAVSAFLGEAIKTAAKFGDNQLVKEIQGLFKSHKLHRRTMDGALSLSMYNAAARSDLTMIDDIIDIIGDHTTRSNFPRLIPNILQNFNLEPFYTPHMINDYKVRLVDLLNKIDPEWRSSKHNGVTITKLEPFYYLSTDARRVLSYVHQDDINDFRTEIMLARSYAPKSKKTLIESMYSAIVVKLEAENKQRRNSLL